MLRTVYGSLECFISLGTGGNARRETRNEKRETTNEKRETKTVIILVSRLSFLVFICSYVYSSCIENGQFAL